MPIRSRIRERMENSMSPQSRATPLLCSRYRRLPRYAAGGEHVWKIFDNRDGVSDPGNSRIGAGCEDRSRQRFESDGLVEERRVFRIRLRLRHRAECESELSMAEVRRQDI